MSTDNDNDANKENSCSNLVWLSFLLSWHWHWVSCFSLFFWFCSLHFWGVTWSSSL